MQARMHFPFVLQMLSSAVFSEADICITEGIALAKERLRALSRSALWLRGLKGSNAGRSTLVCTQFKFIRTAAVESGKMRRKSSQKLHVHRYPRGIFNLTHRFFSILVNLSSSNGVNGVAMLRSESFAKFLLINESCSTKLAPIDPTFLMCQSPCSIEQ